MLENGVSLILSEFLYTNIFIYLLVIMNKNVLYVCFSAFFNHLFDQRFKKICGCIMN